MNVNYKAFHLLSRLWGHFNSKRRLQFFIFLTLTFLASLAEMVSIGAILPFLAILTSPESLFKFKIVKSIIFFLGIYSPSQLLLFVTIFFIIAVLFAALIRLILLWLSSWISFSLGAELSSEMYRKTLYQPYAVHCMRNSSEVINGISNKADLIIYSIVLPALITITSIFVLCGVLLALILIDPIITLVGFGCFGLIYVILIFLVKIQVRNNGNVIAVESTKVIKSLQEGLGGIRDVLIDNSQKTFVDIYHDADNKLRRAQGINLFIGNSPKYILEAMGMTLIAMLAFILTNKNSSDTLPIIGALALGAQRLLPVLQQIYSAWVSIQASLPSLEDALDLLEQPNFLERLNIDLNSISNDNKILFEKSIELKNVSFRYSHKLPYIFKNINLKINKGQFIGFVGVTGVGKSTLIDVLISLLQPTSGSLEIDGKKLSKFNQSQWQCKIAHVPQSIFLTDASIEENIAFGIPANQIDSLRVKDVAKQACISSSIEKLPLKYKTFVGERGIRLSGGQKQRIGIARALYKGAEVLIFDEATSSLDNKTELAVMRSIAKLNRKITLLVIAHRVSTLKNCDLIVELKQNALRVGSFSKIIKINN
jgi:ABC-type multidrug transport system fused ATPase/permease subunit